MHTCYSYPCAITLLECGWAGLTDLLLANRMRHREQCVTFRIRLQKALACMPYSLTLREASGHVETVPMGRPTWQETEGGLQPTISN